MPECSYEVFSTRVALENEACCKILVSTHVYYDISIQILVLDEADRILDLGFKDTLDSILENLPSSRQTLLFSATFNKSIHNLVRLSLNNPQYVSVHAADVQATPSNLTQSYVVCSLEHKLDLLFSFIKAHLKSKVLVFMSTCKQVVTLVYCILQQRFTPAISR